MKKILVLLSVIQALSVKAQTSIYHPFPDSNATWCSEFITLNCFILRGIDIKSTVELNGTAIINGRVYNRLDHYEIYVDNCGPTFTSIDTSTYYIRQDTLLKKVWLYDSSTGGDTILFDFDLHDGDTLDASKEYWTHFFNGGQSWLVTSIDSALIDGQFRKRFNYVPLHDTACQAYNASMIEGIGSLSGFTFAPQTCAEYGTILNLFVQNNMVLYGDTSAPNRFYNCHSFTTGIDEQSLEPTYTFSPNPFHATGFLEVNSQFENSKLEIYNSIGELVRQQNILNKSATIHRNELSQGLYFFKVINGKGRLLSGRFIIE
jgi:hypothetical protein